MKNNVGLTCPFVVKFVSFEYTKLIDIEGEFRLSYKVADALVRARNYNLQLVCFTRPEGNELAFCKIIDFNKWQYNEEKKKKKQQLESRRETKEIRFTPHIADNDIDHKMRQVNEFLDDGDDVVLIMKAKGRDRIHFNDVEKRMNEIVKKCDGHGKESSRKKTGDLIIVRLVKGSNKVSETINKGEVDEQSK